MLERPAPDSKAQRLILSACALALFLTYARLYFGVDLGDEAFHIVVPYRYVLGAQPFVDEVNITQIGSGLLSYPFIAAYHEVVGMDGIVLFSRHLYFLFALGVMAATFFSLRTFVRSTVLALPLSLLVVVFIPNNVPSLNYNSLGNGFFTAGCFLGLAYLRNRNRRYLTLAGLAHGLAIFSYPTLALPVATYAAALYFLSGRSWSALIAYAGVVALPCAAWVAVLLNDGVANARDQLELARTVTEGRDYGADRAITIVRDALAGFPLAPLALAALVSATRLYQRRARLSVALLLLLPLFALPARPVDLSTSAASIHYVANLGLLGVPLFFFLRSHDLSRRLMIGIWIPAFVAGWAVSWSTFTGGSHQGIGFFPAAIVATLLLISLVRRVCQQSAGTHLPLTTSFLVPLVPLAALVALQFSSAHHDASPLRLHSRIESGPYAGLLTKPSTKRFLTALSGDLKLTTDSRCGIMFYYALPGGYLLSPSPPFTNTAFTSDADAIKTVYGRKMLDYYASRRRLPEVAVRLTQVPYYGPGRPRYSPGDSLDSLVLGPKYARVILTPAYAIYARRGSRCGPGRIP